MNSNEKKALRVTACKVRIGAVTGVYCAKSGHPGGSLSAADVFTYLYFKEMHVDPKNPKDPDRDRFVLSKGHACPGLYAALAERGYFPKEELKSLRHIGAMLQGHPDMNKTPGIDFTTGSLGNGISLGVGMALAARYKGYDYYTYVITGDGELQEGVVWEAL
jgi:transketolase